MRGKLIAIEGTDCSGKETQTNLLITKLRKDGLQVQNFSFPNYNSPTGRIIGGSYLGKEYIGESIFDEGPTNVDPKVASLYYAADRKYNIDKILFLLENGYNVILDRYIYSNMAHQGGKMKSEEERMDIYDFLEKLEFDLLKLPKPDITLFLYMPHDVSFKLKENRDEPLDGHEKDDNYLIMAEKSYLELAQRYDFKIIDCSVDGNPKSREEISEFVYKIVKQIL